MLVVVSFSIDLIILFLYRINDRHDTSNMLDSIKAAIYKTKVSSTNIKYTVERCDFGKS